MNITERHTGLIGIVTKHFGDYNAVNQEGKDLLISDLAAVLVLPYEIRLRLEDAKTLISLGDYAEMCYNLMGERVSQILDKYDIHEMKSPLINILVNCMADLAIEDDGWRVVFNFYYNKQMELYK